jgi:hypothetical protein
MTQDMDLRVLHVNEADAIRDVAAILKRVQAGAEVVIERSECIALAEAHERETGQAPVLDPDFAAEVENIVHNRKPWNPPSWD